MHLAASFNTMTGLAVSLLAAPLHSAMSYGATTRQF